MIKDTIHKCLKRILTKVVYFMTLGKAPVERDRWLFGHNGLGMIKFAGVVAITVPILIWLGTALFTTGNDLLGNYDTDVEVLKGKVDGDSVSVSAVKPDTAHTDSHFWAVLSQYTDPGNLPAAQGTKGRLIALLCAIAGIFCLSGFAVSSLISFISRETERWKQGLLHYDYMFDKYVVIIGCNELTSNIVKMSLKRSDVDYVLIQTRQDVEKMRMRLDLDLDKDEENKLVFYFAERTSREDIEVLHLEKAVEIFILGEDITATNEEDRDTFNISCLEHISEHFKEVRINDKKKVHVNLEYQSTFTAFKSTHIYRSLDKNVEFLPFNIHSIWAKKILVDNFAIVPVGKKGEVKVQNYLPIDSIHGIQPNDDKTVHLVIAGMNQMGTALGVQAALLCHFPNAHRDRNLRTTITFIDEQANREGEFFRGRFATLFDLCKYRNIEVGKDNFEKDWFDPMEKGRYKHLKENFMDIQWEFIQGNISSDEVRKYLTNISSDKSKVTTIAICFNHPQVSFAAALYLPEMVYRRAMQILVYQQNNFDLAEKISSGEKVWKRYEKLRPFGMVEGCYTEDAFDNPVAKLLHYLYSEHYIGADHDKTSPEIKYDYKTLKDLSEKVTIDVNFVRGINSLWSQQGIVEKLSNIDMADSIPMKMRSLGVTIDNINEFNERLSTGRTLELMAKAEHTRWLTERISMGFRPLDNVKDEWQYFQNKDLRYQDRKKRKNFWKNKSRAHLDICSNTKLNEVDPCVHYNDIDVVCYIPQLLNYRELINVMRLADSATNNSITVELLKLFVSSHVNGKVTFAPKLVKDKDNSLQTFWLLNTAVSQKQWESIMGSNPVPVKMTGANKPIVNVSKNEIDDFLKVLRKMTGLCFDLPTFKEWKYAAETSTKNFSKQETFEKITRFSKGSDDLGGPCDVNYNKEKQKNDLCIYNMLGNVWEWTKTENKSRQGCYYYCGGSWRFTPLYGDMSDDYWYSFWKPDLKSDDIGFRLVWRFNVDSISPKTLNTLQLTLDNISAKPINEVQCCGKESLKDKIDGMIKISPVGPGYFVMGTENDKTVTQQSLFPQSWMDKDADTTETPHLFVKIDNFKIGTTPVTQKLWNVVMGIEAKNNPSSNLGDNKPQTNVSWRKINDEFLPRLNAITKEQYRLPTEAEWEYAAKGGDKSPICDKLRIIFDDKELSVEEKRKKVYGILSNSQRYNLYSGSNDSTKLGLYIHTTTSDIDTDSFNELGLCDMSGNVWEWCIDKYKHDAHKEWIDSAEYKENGYISNPNKPKMSDAPIRDKAKVTNETRVFKGGSWKFDAKSCRCTSINFWIDSDTDDDLGFRLVLDGNEEKPLDIKDKTV